MSLSNILMSDTGAAAYKQLYCQSITESDGNNLPYFQGLKSNASLVINASNHLNTYDSKSGPLSDQFNLATGKFTPAVSGLYLITGRCQANGGVPSTGNILFSLRNVATDTVIQYVCHGYVGGLITPTFSGVVYLSDADQYNMSVYQTILSPLPATGIIYTVVLLSK
jgi:hypothetical protein